MKNLPIVKKLPSAEVAEVKSERSPPVWEKLIPPPNWEGLSSPLDLDEIEAKASEFYVGPVRRLVKALCDEIRDLR